MVSRAKRVCCRQCDADVEGIASAPRTPHGLLDPGIVPCGRVGHGVESGAGRHYKHVRVTYGLNFGDTYILDPHV